MEKVDNRIIDELINDGIIVLKSQDGRNYSTFRSGGLLNYVIFPKSQSEFMRSLDLLENRQYHILGLGSNTLICDDGVNCVLSTKKMTGYKIDGDILYAEAGEKLSVLSFQTALSGKSGLEFAVGIPGTVGGAVCMNAGAHGKEMKDVLLNVSVYRDRKIIEYTPDELDMQYRYCGLDNAKVLSCAFKLTPFDANDSLLRIQENLRIRRRTQPALPSLGSVFKRINGESPWIYVKGVGMQGASIGNARISELHGNFIVNSGGATSNDYLLLLEDVQRKVYQKFGLNLQPEIKYIKD